MARPEYFPSDHPYQSKGSPIFERNRIQKFKRRNSDGNRPYVPEYGYSGTTFQKIADELNITKGAITYHFKNKFMIWKRL